MKSSFFKYFALPISLVFGNELLANHLSGVHIYESSHENLLACGGGGGGGGGGMTIKDRKAKDLKKAKRSLQFFQSKKAEAEAKGESTDSIMKKIEQYQEKIMKLEN
tara:strand:+ start:121 stop:441 length:321 start_codon:yes stop_codon:yes gene_type:complete